MIGLLVNLLVVLLVLGAVYAIVKLLVVALGLPGVIIQVVGIVVLVVFLIWLLNVLVAFGGSPFWPAVSSTALIVDESTEHLAISASRMMAKMHAAYFKALQEQGIDGVTALSMTEAFIAATPRPGPGSGAPKPKEGI